MLWLIIIVIVVLITIVVINWYQPQHNKNSKQLQITTTLQELHKIINDICYRCNLPINYRLIIDENLSFVELDENIINIHLVVWNKQYKRPYTLNSLLLHVITELMTITKQTQLLSIAQQLGYYNNSIVVEEIPGMST